MKRKSVISLILRKSIKYKIIRLVNSYLNREIDRKEFKVRMCAYYGWLKHADAKNLLYKIQSLTGVRYSNWNGKRTNITKYDWRIYAKNRKEKVKPQT